MSTMLGSCTGHAQGFIQDFLWVGGGGEEVCAALL